MKYDLSKRADVYILNGKLAKYTADGKKVELKLWRQRRSNQQNAYLHVCIGFIAEETGYTVEEAKTMLKRKFGRYLVYEKNGEKFLASSSELDSLQLTEFIDFIRHTASETLGISIPTPEQYYTDAFEIEKHLQHVQ